ncbi:MAG: serine--tRNA ligase [Candidatus Gracilibacteria bacterium]
MIDIKDLRSRPDYYKTSTSAKNADPSVVDLVMELDDKRKSARLKFDDLRAEQNRLSKEIPTADAGRKVELMEKSKAISGEIKELDTIANEAEKAFAEALSNIPNPIHESVVVGKDDSENVVLRYEGKKPEFDFEPKEHWEIAENLGLLDMERGAKVSGSRFYYMKGDLVMLERAMMDFVLKKIVSKGFTAMVPPFLVKERAMWGTGFFPADKNEIYTVNPGEDDLYLIGTSEVPLVNYHDSEVLDIEEKPLRYVGISPCFRREAGSYGKDTKGILRVHQFEKVEMVIFTTPENSWKEHEMIREIEEEILKDLEIPYQVLNICSGDLGWPAAKKYDLEAWMPGQGKYREVTSTSNTTDFQTRRLNIRYKDKDGNTKIAYSLNGTGSSMRPLIAIIENYQEKDGSIRIPKVLQDYMQKERITV